MKTDLQEIENTLKDLLKKQSPPLQVRIEKEGQFEVAGTKEVMQGKQKVGGHYFASIIPKAKDIRLYYFPIYTHANEFNISDDLNKCLKGKSCFHIKKLSPELEKEIGEMMEKGVRLYEKDGLV